MNILVLNAGSSSQKSCLYDFANFPNLTNLTGQPPHPRWEAHIDWSCEPGQAVLTVQTAAGVTHKQTTPSQARSTDTAAMLETLWTGETAVIASPDQIDIVGHRVVHGGRAYSQSVWIDATVKAAIARLAEFAPVHNPANLQGIEAVEARLGSVQQVAVFDTAFHSHLPDVAAVYPLPYEWFERGVRRYGFHGISHQYCRDRMAQLLNTAIADLCLITCHLGNGCSLTAIREGKSIETTMGFTPLEGVMMGSRSGSIDPGIILHLLRQPGYSVDDVDALLNRQSGLLGVSGISSDLRSLLAAAETGHERAQLAISVYVYRLQGAVGAMLPRFAQLPLLVFTAGVGENSHQIRSAVCAGFEFLGLKLDATANEQRRGDRVISTADSTIPVWVIHTQEDWAIAQECWRLVTGK